MLLLNSTKGDNFLVECGFGFASFNLQFCFFFFLKILICVCIAVCKVLGLEEGKECIIVGTLFKHMKLKPCVLDEYSKEVRSLLLQTLD